MKASLDKVRFLYGKYLLELSRISIRYTQGKFKTMLLEFDSMALGFEEEPKKTNILG